MVNKIDNCLSCNVNLKRVNSRSNFFCPLCEVNGARIIPAGVPQAVVQPQMQVQQATAVPIQPAPQVQVAPVEKQETGQQKALRIFTQGVKNFNENLLS